jgi:hypothetical protein
MLTIEDCIEMSGLTPEEIEAIAAHEHIPIMLAVELGWYLEQTTSGKQQVRQMIADDIAHAQAIGDHAHAAKLKLVLKHYVEHHHCG